MTGTHEYYDESLSIDDRLTALMSSGLAGFLEDPEESAAARSLGYAPLPYSDQAVGTLAPWS